MCPQNKFTNKSFDIQTLSQVPPVQRHSKTQCPEGEPPLRDRDTTPSLRAARPSHLRQWGRGQVVQLQSNTETGIWRQGARAGQGRGSEGKAPPPKAAKGAQPGGRAWAQTKGRVSQSSSPLSLSCSGTKCVLGKREMAKCYRDHTSICKHRQIQPATGCMFLSDKIRLLGARPNS